jgi:glycosyltransferase involved in cell wall biosynthesis
MKISVAQLGARMHYAVPSMLYEKNILATLYTDINSAKNPVALAKYLPTHCQPSPVRRLLSRECKTIPALNTKEFTRLGIYYAVMRSLVKSNEGLLRLSNKTNKAFNKWCIRNDIHHSSAVYGFNSAASEIFEATRTAGGKRILEQTIAPKTVETKILNAAQLEFPEWVDRIEENDAYREFIERERSEWESANIIICGSDFVARGIEAAGGPKDKCIVIPYGVAEPTMQGRRQLTHDSERKLNVLTVGAVGLRKGTPYLWKAASSFLNSVNFRMVGPITCSEKLLKNRPSNVEIFGAISRHELTDHYRWADVFLLPSLCEGSATVTYEAALHGLPVLCSSNTGSTTINGQDGIVFDAMSTDAIVKALVEIKDSPDLIEFFRTQTNILNAKRSITAYKNRLSGVIQSVMGDDLD